MLSHFKHYRSIWLIIDRPCLMLTNIHYNMAA